MSKKARKKTLLAFYVLLFSFAAVASLLVLRLSEYRNARNEYDGYQEIFIKEEIPPATSEPSLPKRPEATIPPTAKPYYNSKVAALKKENGDTVGWIDIDGADIQYPIVQTANNEYYMNRTFKKRKNSSGAIFMDCWNSPDFTDFNTVIYGHNMKDGSMFAGLREYRHQGFLDAHSRIEITMINKKLRYRIFAAYTSQGEGGADFRGQTCVTPGQRSDFIKSARKRSDVVSTATVSRDDKLLTLVTCTGGSHPWFWVVHAVLVAG